MPVVRRVQTFAPVDLRWAVLAHTLGVLLVFLLKALPSPQVLVVFLLASGVPWRGRLPVAAFALGVVLCSWHGQRYLDQRWPAERHGEQMSVTGVIASLPERQQNDKAQPNWRFEFEPLDAATLPPRIRVSWYRAEQVPKAGECWQLQLRMRTPRGSFNPGGFDYEGWLLRERIAATASVVGAEACAGAVPAGQPIQRLRQRIVDDIESALGPGQAAALIGALAVGHTSGLRDADWRRFRESGTTHLIAISGFNLAIVSGFVFLLLRWSWTLWPRLCLYVPAQRVALIGSGLFAVFYTALAGFEAPVLRALIMLLLLIVAALLNRLQQPTRVLAYAWGLILLFDPFAALSPGLWLSFAAVLAILFVSLGRLRAPPAWQLAVLVQLMLSLALVPLTLQFFGGFAWLAPLVNLVAVPLFALLTPAVLLVVAVLMLHSGSGAWLLQYIAAAIELLLGGLDGLLAALPSPWISASPPWEALLLGAAGAALLWLPRGMPARWLAVPCLASLALPRPVPPTVLELIALDVGQGTAVIVRTASHSLLVDAGPAFEEGFDAGRSVVVPALLARGITRLDALLLSHEDNDHAGGVAAVRELMPVARLIGVRDGEACRDGMHWRWDGIDFRILHPGSDSGSSNNRSCVLKIDGPFRILLPGDIEAAAERRLLSTHRDDLAADVLLSPHHGSRTSSTPAFVTAVDAEIVIHSAAWRSRFGHPRPEVVDRYEAGGARQYGTAIVGALSLAQDASGTWRVSAERRDHARWWHAASRP